MPCDGDRALHLWVSAPAALSAPPLQRDLDSEVSLADPCLFSPDCCRVGSCYCRAAPITRRGSLQGELHPRGLCCGAAQCVARDRSLAGMPTCLLQLMARSILLVASAQNSGDPLVHSVSVGLSTSPTERFRLRGSPPLTLSVVSQACGTSGFCHHPLSLSLQWSPD